LIQGGYELATGRFHFERMGIWEPWFYIGAALFAVNLWLFWHKSKGDPHPVR